MANVMVLTYVKLIRAGRRVLDEVPERIRDEVREALAEETEKD